MNNTKHTRLSSINANDIIADEMNEFETSEKLEEVAHKNTKHEICSLN